jgi:hypothetical protein
MSGYFSNDDLESSFSAFIEDDDRVAYLYLSNDGEIVADVWLYNLLPAPSSDDWGSMGELPYLNPNKFIHAEHFEPVKDSSEVKFVWCHGQDGFDHLDLFIRGVHHATLKRDSKPGWCRLIASGGPLGLPLTNSLV